MGEAALAFELNEAIKGVDERENRRENIYVAIDLFSEHNFWSGLSMNMSEGGVFVATHAHLPVGSKLLLNMLLPFEKAPIVVQAEVRWTRDYTGQREVPPGLGLQFCDLDPVVMRKIRKFVGTMREPLLFED